MASSAALTAARPDGGRWLMRSPYRRDHRGRIGPGTPAVRGVGRRPKCSGRLRLADEAAGGSRFLRWGGRRSRQGSGTHGSGPSGGRLLTGLHEPEASHLLTLEAIAGRAVLRRGYAEALERRYLWHEFGDTHLLLPAPGPHSPHYRSNFS
ncbi:S-adenosylmethionine:tRNA ribosyltransferase-isomerase [Streptomyces halstedii]|uniref:S-adenosylmethionine:tRNA ribosyltransferase-isomerase n=1 Tax=Streptomyces halstedii TaxID=1944 RepID=UPI0036C7E3E1